MEACHHWALDAQSVNDSANELAEVIDNLSANRDSFLAANDAAADFQSRAANISSDVGESRAALAVLQRAWLADNEADLQVLWDQFDALFTVGIDPEVASLAEREWVFYVRGQQLAFTENLRSLTA